MINYLYGKFSNKQIAKFKDKLHKKLFWLLLYKDPKTAQNYKSVDFAKYFENLMKEIDGLNELLCYPVPIIEICCKLQAAYTESCTEQFDYQVYRKFVLDAHNLVDKIGEEDVV